MMNRTGKAALWLSVIGLLLILAGIVYTRYCPLTPTSDTVSAETLYFSNVRELIVITGTLPINVELTDGDICEVSCMGDLKLVTSSDEQGTLRLTQDDSFSLALLTLRKKDFHLTVRLPRIKYRRVSLSTSSGAVRCDNVNCDSLEISTRSGNITLPEADERLKIRTDSGKVDISLAALNDDLTLTAGTGDVRLTLAEDISCCLKFLTEGGSLVKNGEKLDKGDRALVMNGGEHVLTVNTSSGDLILS